jgi:hypothetical protein
MLFDFDLCRIILLVIDTLRTLRENGKQDA